MRIATRYEVKYRISLERAEEVRHWIARYMEPDAFGEGGSARYDVHSMYLDSADWRIYRETRNGNFSRFKLRARKYTFDGHPNVFLEVKSRDGEAMRKTRAEVSHDDACRVLYGGVARNATGTGLDNFRNHMDRYRAYPRAWVTYKRFAYVGGDRGLVRITFDSDIACAPPTPDLTAPPVWYPLEIVKGIVVLELKYSGSYPAWAADTVRRFDLERRSMSKYRYAVETLRQLEIEGERGVRGLLEAGS